MKIGIQTLSEFIDILIGDKKAYYILTEDLKSFQIELKIGDILTFVHEVKEQRFFYFTAEICYIEQVLNNSFQIVSLNNIQADITVYADKPVYCASHSRINKLDDGNSIGEIPIEEFKKFWKKENAKIKWPGKKYHFLTYYGTHIRLNSIGG